MCDQYDSLFEFISIMAVSASKVSQSVGADPGVPRAAVCRADENEKQNEYTSLRSTHETDRARYVTKLGCEPGKVGCPWDESGTRGKVAVSWANGRKMNGCDERRSESLGGILGAKKPRWGRVTGRQN